MTLHVAEELRSVLCVEDVRRAIATRNTTDVRCAACGRQVPAGSPETVNVVVSVDAMAGVPVMQFAHGDCAESGFTGAQVACTTTGGLWSRCRLREHPTVPAVLVWEPCQQLRVDGEDAHTRLYRWMGLRPSRWGTGATNGPWIATLTVRLTAARAAVVLSARGVKVIARKMPGHPRPSVGEAWDEFPLTPTPTIAQWRELAERTRRCLLVTGTGLGLEHPSVEREDMLLEDGEALAGVAPVSILAEGGARR